MCNPTVSDPGVRATFPFPAAARLPLHPDSAISREALGREGPCQKIQLLLCLIMKLNTLIRISNYISEILIHLGLVLRELAFFIISLFYLD